MRLEGKSALVTGAGRGHNVCRRWLFLASAFERNRKIALMSLFGHNRRSQQTNNDY